MKREKDVQHATVPDQTTEPHLAQTTSEGPTDRYRQGSAGITTLCHHGTEESRGSDQEAHRTCCVCRQSEDTTNECSIRHC